MSNLQASPALWTAALASAACLLGVGAATAAEAMTSATQVPVSYRDLNLSTPSGASALYSRLESAARIACGYPNWEYPPPSPALRACSKQAIASAVAEVNSPLLTAIHNARSGKLTAMN